MRMRKERLPTKNDKGDFAPMRAAAIVGLVIAALLSAFTSYPAYGQQTGHDPGGGSRLCNPNPPEYPGCTPSQIKDWEVGTKPDTNKHYRQNRWGQAGYDWSNLTHDAAMQQMYSNAVDRYIADMEAQGFTGDAAKPKYQTWAGFKSNTYCSGGYLGSAWTFMCKFVVAENEAIDNIGKLTLTCTGIGLAASAASGTATIAERMTFAAISAAKLGAWGAGGVAGCVTALVWDSFWGNPFGRIQGRLTSVERSRQVSGPAIH